MLVIRDPALFPALTNAVVTSGTFGPTVQKNIALAYVPAALSKVGTELAVRIRERDVPAKVVKTPFYKRGG